MQQGLFSVQHNDLRRAELRVISSKQCIVHHYFWILKIEPRRPGLSRVPTLQSRLCAEVRCSALCPGLLGLAGRWEHREGRAGRAKAPHSTTGQRENPPGSRYLQAVLLSGRGPGAGASQAGPWGSRSDPKGSLVVVRWTVSFLPGTFLIWSLLLPRIDRELPGAAIPVLLLTDHRLAELKGMAAIYCTLSLAILHKCSQQAPRVNCSRFRSQLPEGTGQGVLLGLPRAPAVLRRFATLAQPRCRGARVRAPARPCSPRKPTSTGQCSHSWEPSEGQSIPVPIHLPWDALHQPQHHQLGPGHVPAPGSCSPTAPAGLGEGHKQGPA